MKLYAKVLPKYFEELRENAKPVEYRQLESMILLNSETGEEIEITNMRKNPHAPSIMEDYPDVNWDPDKDIYEIRLGRRL